ncbi:MAG: sugar phosphate isomerase/epimerase [Verrucomicrobiia bacterium]|jgi:sugar phosphate isomerase/epimerase
MKTTCTSPHQLTRRQFITAAALTIPALRVAEVASAGAYQIGCYTRPWGEHDWRVALDAIAGAGFKYAGLMTTNTKNHLVVSAASTVEEAQAVGEEVKKRGLKVASLWGGGFAVEKSLETGVADLKKLIDNCVACGTTQLMVGGTGNAKLHEVYYKAVAEACDYAATKGVGLSVKPHGGSNSTGAQCRKIVELVGKKNFGLWYDPGNIFFYSNGALDPAKDSAEVNGLVVGMSVKDYRLMKEDPAAPAKKKSPYGGDVALTPGTGMVNFEVVMANLKKGGFTRGPLIVECLEKGDLPALAVEAKKARMFLEKLTGQKA